MRTKFDIYVFT